jgi:hypothetical protein
LNGNARGLPGAGPARRSGGERLETIGEGMLDASGLSEADG